jgi:hypothetical protein
MTGSSFDITLTNSDNIAYSGPVFVGTPLQGNSAALFVYDTGSGYLTIPSSNCNNCKVKFLYNSAASSTFSTTASYSSTKLLSYGSINLTGSMVSDTVCLQNTTNADSCVNDFSFFLVTKENGQSSFSGILGLAPAANGNGPSYMEALHA